jgi:hypothetical protein
LSSPSDKKHAVPPMPLESSKMGLWAVQSVLALLQGDLLLTKAHGKDTSDLEAAIRVLCAYERTLT